ncbi:hypothetical protein Aduo_011957 [Ancylostoma duodenale]
MTTAVMYDELPDICAALGRSEDPHSTMFMGPTTKEVAPDGECLKLIMAVTNVVRIRSKFVTLAPPRKQKNGRVSVVSKGVQHDEQGARVCQCRKDESGGEDITSASVVRTGFSCGDKAMQIENC